MNNTYKIEVYNLKTDKTTRYYLKNITKTMSKYERIIVNNMKKGIYDNIISIYRNKSNNYKLVYNNKMDKITFQNLVNMVA